MAYRPLKFALKTGLNTIKIQGGGYGSHVAFQRGQLTLWTNAKTDQPEKETTLMVALTGQEVEAGEYLGTAISEDGSFVVHVFTVQQ